jgi:allophanate hydrolase subunit 1
VPTGAVALAGEFSGVYPRESPGGWQIIGQTDLKAWDLNRNPPALMTPGTRVSFKDVDKDA